jgi:hypothetical protein
MNCANRELRGITENTYQKPSWEVTTLTPALPYYIFLEIDTSIK